MDNTNAKKCNVGAAGKKLQLSKETVRNLKIKTGMKAGCVSGHEFCVSPAH